jgi:hypothetical protein
VKIPWDNVQLRILTTWMEHRESCPAITLLDKRCVCGLLEQLVKVEYPGAELQTP